MALRQVNSAPFPYRETMHINAEKTSDARYFEFERTVFLHSLSLYCSADAVTTVSFTFPSTFTNGGSASNWVEIFAGTVGVGGLFMAPGAVTAAPPTASAPLPAAFPQGSVLRVTVASLSNTVEAQVFLVASG